MTQFIQCGPKILMCHWKCPAQKIPVEDDSCTKFLHLKKQSPRNSTIFYASYVTLFWYFKCWMKSIPTKYMKVQSWKVFWCKYTASSDLDHSNIWYILLHSLNWWNDIGFDVTEAKMLMGLEVHQDGVKLANYVAWRSAVAFVRF